MNLRLLRQIQDTSSGARLTLRPPPGKPNGMSAQSDLSGSLLHPGARLLDRYELIKELGRGGMGVVWLTRDDALGIECACKFLPDLLRQDRASLDELRDEARRNLRLTNENIVRIYDFIDGDQIAGISMEYVDGETLSSKKASSPYRHLEATELFPLIRQLCVALHYAHTGPRIVHRDLKPANLMVTRDGRLKITDFGIARSISDSFSRVSNAQPSSGTLVFMSPQQLMGEPPRPTDDIYSVGSTIYDLLTTKPPFHTGSVAVQVLQVRPPSMMERREQMQIPGQPIPAVWEDVVAACLAKDPSQRPATALEIINRLEAGLAVSAYDHSITVTQHMPTETATAQAAPPVAPNPPTAYHTPPSAHNTPPFPPPLVPSPSAIVPAPPQYPTPLPPPTNPPTYYPTPPPPEPQRGGNGVLIGLLVFGLLVAIAAAGFFALKDRILPVAENSTPSPRVAPVITTPTPENTKPGKIMVNTIPSGARVYVDGRDVGTSPVTMSDAGVGEHRVRVEKAEYENLEIVVIVQGGQIADPGTLHLVSVPKPAAPPTIVQVPIPSTKTETYTPPPPPPPAVDDLGEAAINEVAARYLSSTQRRDVNSHMSCYTNPVDYYDEGTLSTTRLRASIKNNFETWPYFDLSLVGSRIESTGDPIEKILHVDYRFTARSGRKVSSGLAHDSLTVRKYSDGVYIRRVRQVVTNRQKNW